jgi:hypothetical protein
MERERYICQAEVRILTTSRTGASISGGLGVGVTALAEVISARMDDDGALEFSISSDSIELKLILVHTPITLSGPINLMSLSVTDPVALPWLSVLKLPKSPT